METKITTFELETTKQFELIDITQPVRNAVRDSGVQSGIMIVFSQHTTGAIRVNHNEPLLFQDIMKALFRMIPVNISYSHDLFELRATKALDERSNGHAHVKSFLLGSSESFIIDGGQVLLGEKQSIFFVELDGGRKRQVHLKIVAG